MDKWIISDTHFGHKNVIEYCNRPFRSVEEMDAKLIKNWNNVVKANDIVYHLGDFALSKSKQEVSDLVQQLHGRIVLVMGNHDKNNLPYYYDCGFYRVYDRPVFIESDVVLSHNQLQHNCAPSYSIFGHIHNELGYNIADNEACVCCERINYTPINYDRLIAELQSNQAN